MINIREIVEVGLLNETNLVKIKLELIELENGLFRIELNHENLFVSGEADSYFEALNIIREQLEQINCQIVCKGACQNVYPSAMMLNMGEGRKAYTLYHGLPAKFDDIVDIFEFDESLNCVSVNEQIAYYDEWFDSLKRG